MALLQESVRMMGTIIDLKIEHDSNAASIIEEVIQRLKMYEHRFSANNASSELMQVNQQAGIQPVAVHPELFQLIEIGKQHSIAPESHLNIAMGPLVQTWRIGFADAKVPTTTEIRQLLKKTNPQNIHLDSKAQTVFLTETDMAIDLGALAKGFIADLLIDYLQAENVSSALINLGGNIMTLNAEKNTERSFWKIGIQNPNSLAAEPLLILQIANQSVVTSGIYERTHEEDGRRYHHIFDPKTGYPIESDVVSLTVVSERSVDGEIWTTRLFGKPAGEIIRHLNKLEGIHGLVITNSGEILLSQAIEAMVL